MDINTVVVTGATGFIGGALTKKLLQQGKKVYAVDIDESKLEQLKQYGNVVPVKAYFEDYQNMHNLIKDDIDVFYHFAWQGVFGEAFKDYELQLSNAKYTCDAICVATRLNCKKFVFAGTVNEYEIKKYLDKEYFEPRFTCVYSTSKLASEMICKTLAFNNGIEYNAGLVSMVYGEYNMSKMLPYVLIKHLVDNIRPKLVEGNNKYDLVYIDDVVNAFLAIGEKGLNMKSYYIGHRKLKTFKDIVIDIKDVLNPDMKLLFGEFKDTSDMDYSLIDLDALYNDTGFECQSDFKESILRTAEWVKTLEM
ncbi:MAG: NAD(P)-dependent oxidoreductase [Oscillospiraceae bacterium]